MLLDGEGEESILCDVHITFSITDGSHWCIFLLSNPTPLKMTCFSRINYLRENQELVELPTPFTSLYFSDSSQPEISPQGHSFLHIHWSYS